MSAILRRLPCLRMATDQVSIAMAPNTRGEGMLPSCGLQRAVCSALLGTSGYVMLVESLCMPIVLLSHEAAWVPGCPL